MAVLIVWSSGEPRRERPYSYSGWYYNLCLTVLYTSPRLSNSQALSGLILHMSAGPPGFQLRCLLFVLPPDQIL